MMKFIFLIGLVFVSVVKADKSHEEVFGFYIAGDDGGKKEDSELTEPNKRTMRGLSQMASLKKNTKVGIAAYIDEPGEDPNYFYDISDITSLDSKAEYLVNPVSENAVRKLGNYFSNFKYQEKDSGSPATIYQFLMYMVMANPNARLFHLAILAHSWGKFGLAEDFTTLEDGKIVNLTSKSATMFRNYDFRRVLEEVKRVALKEFGRKIEFSVLITDACIWASLDTTLEIADQFKYFIGTSLETPFHSVSYNKILDPYIYRVNAARYNNQKEHDVDIEKYILKSFVRSFIKEHAPEKELALAEGQVDVVHSIAIRTSELKKVVRKFDAFVQSFPNIVKTSFQNEKPKSIFHLLDGDQNIDLLLLARTYKRIFLKEYEKSGEIENSWKIAADKAQELIDAIGYEAPNPTLQPIALENKTAKGAWVKIEIDPHSKADVALCNALQSFTALNRPLKRPLPKIKDKDGNLVDLKEKFCDELAENYAKENKKTEVASTEIASLFDMTVTWPNKKVPGRLLQEKDKRYLVMWIEKEASEKSFATSYIFRLPATKKLEIHYVKTDPQEYIQKGFENRGVQPIALSSYFYVTDSQYFKTPLVVAAGHSNGTNKEVLSIFMDNEMPRDSDFHTGFVPAEWVEKQPYSLSTEQYVNFQKALKKNGQVTEDMVKEYGGSFKNLKEGQPLKLFIRKGFNYYRLSRIPASWVNFLEGK